MMKITVFFISDYFLIQGMQSLSPLFFFPIFIYFLYIYICRICGMNACVGITCLPLKVYV
jgi:hypothetical protein